MVHRDCNQSQKATASSKTSDAIKFRLVPVNSQAPAQNSAVTKIRIARLFRCRNLEGPLRCREQKSAGRSISIPKARNQRICSMFIGLRTSTCFSCLRLRLRSRSIVRNVESSVFVVCVYIACFPFFEIGEHAIPSSV